MLLNEILFPLSVINTALGARVTLTEPAGKLPVATQVSAPLFATLFMALVPQLSTEGAKALQSCRSLDTPICKVPDEVIGIPDTVIPGVLFAAFIEVTVPLPEEGVCHMGYADGPAEVST